MRSMRQLASGSALVFAVLGSVLMVLSGVGTLLVWILAQYTALLSAQVSGNIILFVLLPGGIVFLVGMGFLGVADKLEELGKPLERNAEEVVRELFREARRSWEINNFANVRLSFEHVHKTQHCGQLLEGSDADVEKVVIQVLERELAKEECKGFKIRRPVLASLDADIRITLHYRKGNRFSIHLWFSSKFCFVSSTGGLIGTDDLPVNRAGVK